MANTDESNPLLPNQQSEVKDEKKPNKPITSTTVTPPFPADPVKPLSAAVPMGWTADGLPMGHGVVGDPNMRRAQWDSGLCACFGRTDEFCSSDIEVCEYFFLKLIGFYAIMD